MGNPHKNGLRLRLPDRGYRSLPYHCSLGKKEIDPEEEIDDGSDNTTRNSQLYYIDMEMSNVICLWAMLPLLDGFGRRLMSLRDSVMGNSESGRHVSNALTQLEDHVVFSSDVAAVASELSRDSRGGFPLLSQSATFVPRESRFYEKDMTLGGLMTKLIVDQSKWVGMVDTSIRDHVAQYGSLLGARENIRLQKNVVVADLVIVRYGNSFIVGFFRNVGVLGMDEELVFAARNQLV